MKNQFGNLRERAYNILDLNHSNNISKSNLDNIIEELLLYQIELELQNANLADTNMQLQRLSKKYSNLYNLAPIAYFTLNYNGIINEINNAASNILGVNKSQLINARFLRYVSKDSQPVFSKYFIQITHELTHESCDIKMIKRTGEKFHARLEGKKLNESNKSNSMRKKMEDQYIIIVSDVTNYHIAIENENLRKQKTEIEKNSYNKDIFLATLSHELRTPITAILCLIRVLKNEVSNVEKITKGLQAIEETILIQNHLINDLLDISSIVLGKISIELKNIDIISIIQHAIESVKIQAQEKNIQIDLKKNVSEIIIALDAARMRQVFFNLLINAIKFTPSQGKVEITVVCLQDKIQIQVRDNGQGIAPDFLPHIFKRFTQADSSSRLHGGLGIGLALVRRLLELQGGTIKADSPGLNEGAVFTIEFPKVKEYT